MSETPATAFLRAKKVEFTPHEYEYVEHGGTSASSAALGVEEHRVVKTLVMEDESKQPLLVLMHGDQKVSTKSLARQLGKKSIAPCDPQVAQRHTGYQVGGTSPFGTRKPLPVAMEKTIAELPELFINGGRRGYLVRLVPSELLRVLEPTLVSCALEK